MLKIVEDKSKLTTTPTLPFITCSDGSYFMYVRSVVDGEIKSINLRLGILIAYSFKDIIDVLTHIESSKETIVEAELTIKF